MTSTPNNKTKTCAIIGAGALGRGLANLLNQNTDLDPLLLTRRTEQIPLLQKLHNTKVADLYSHQAPIDLCVIAVKAYDVAQTLEQLIPHLTQEATVVFIQNGAGFADTWIQQHPNIQWVLAPTTYGAKILPDQTVAIQTGGHLRMGLATQTLAEPPEILKPLLSALPHASWHADIKPWVWQKLAANAIINPLTVIHKCENGKLLEIPEAQKTMAAMAGEITELLEALKIVLPEAILPNLHSILKATCDNVSSTLSDYRAGRPHELFYINKTLILQAQQEGLSCPTNRHILAQVHAQFG